MGEHYFFSLFNDRVTSLPLISHVFVSAVRQNDKRLMANQLRSIQCSTFPWPRLCLSVSFSLISPFFFLSVFLFLRLFSVPTSLTQFQCLCPGSLSLFLSLSQQISVSPSRGSVYLLCVSNMHVCIQLH